MTGSGGDDNTNVCTFTGRLTLSGGAGKDTLVGGLGNDLLYVGENDDSLTGGIGDAALVGGAGLDTLTESLAATTVASNFVLTDRSLSGAGTDSSSLIEMVKLTTSSSNVTSTINATAFSGSTTLTGGARNVEQEMMFHPWRNRKGFDPRSGWTRLIEWQRWKRHD